MTTHLESFAVSLPPKKYGGYFVLLERMGAAEVLPGIFALRSEHDIDQMRVSLLPYLEKADRVLIVAVNGEVESGARCVMNGLLQRIFSLDGQIGFRSKNH